MAAERIVVGHPTSQLAIYFQVGCLNDSQEKGKK
jgi:hypothetical protein